MARRKRNQVVFEMDGKKYMTSTAKIPRFTWGQLYKALLHAKNLVNENTQITIDYALSSGRDTTHKILWDLLCIIEEQVKTKVPRLAFLWIIACYGYIHQLSTDRDEYKAWPHPTYPFKRTRGKFYDYREDLKCPVCLKPFTPHRRYKTKKVIIRQFKSWLNKHLERDAH
jgi:hypothetical protein